MSAQKSTRTSNRETNKNTRKTIRRKPYGEKFIIGGIFLICFLATIFLACLLSAVVALKIPDIRSVSHYRPLQTTLFVDRNGEVVHRLYKENRRVISLSQMPKLLPRAFVAAEDGRFYDHPGLDWLSVLRAFVVNIKRGSKAQGGSTITQQVARSLLLNREKTYLRKFKEAILAWRIDTLLKKDEILYIYLNQIYLGSGAYGVEAASQVYFNKHASELHLGEIALLAGLPQAPSKYSPLRNLKSARARQRYVLNRLAADGYISREEAQLAYEEKIVLNRSGSKNCTDCGYYVNLTRKRARRITGQPLLRQGLTIHTYLDKNLQLAAAEALRHGTMASLGRQMRLGKEEARLPQGALVSMDGCSGEVNVLAGGVDFARSSYDRAALAKRPAGSVFKPIIFSAALMQGWRPDSTILDAPLSIAGGAGGYWQPKNYSGRYHGKVTLREALARSYNTTAVRLLQQVGLSKVHDLSREMGLTSDLPKDLSLALGSLDVSLLELTTAYSSFICGGTWHEPQFIEWIENSDGKVVFKPIPKAKSPFSPVVAQQMKSMLQQVITSGTGSRARGLGGSIGGKTGTTDDNRDAWFIGFHDSQVAGVWVGHDHNQSLGSTENGGRTAAPIWREYMQKNSQDR